MAGGDQVVRIICPAGAGGFDVIHGQLHPGVEPAPVEATIDACVVVPLVGLCAIPRQRRARDIVRHPVAWRGSKILGLPVAGQGWLATGSPPGATGFPSPPGPPLAAWSRRSSGRT